MTNLRLYVITMHIFNCFDLIEKMMEGGVMKIIVSCSSINGLIYQICAVFLKGSLELDQSVS